MENRDIAILSSSPLFKDIELEEIRRLMGSINHHILTFNKGEMIMMQGDRYDSLRILLEGEVSAEIQDYTGRTIKIENLKAPDAMASGILFADDNTLPVTLISLKPIRIVSIPREDVLSLAQQSRKFLISYFSDSGNKVSFLAEKIRLFKFKSLREKFISYILGLSVKQMSDTVTLPYSREKLAELFGVARPSLSRTCSELADEGLVEIKGKIVRIMNREKLIL